MILFDLLAIFAVFSPPFLLGFAWFYFFSRNNVSQQPKWRLILGAVNFSAVSVLLVIFVVKFLRNNCNADAGDWSCVIAWRSFAASIMRLAPLLLVLSLLGVKRTRVLAFISVLAIVFDVVLVDMMA